MIGMGLSTNQVMFLKFNKYVKLFSELVFRNCFHDGNFEERQMKYRGNLKLHL